MTFGKAALMAVALLAASACSGGVGPNSGGTGSGNQGSWTPSEYPQALVGTWEEPGIDGFIKLDANGTCVEKFPDVAATACSYTVTTGGALHPSTSASWILQIDIPKYDNLSFEIVAIDQHQLTVRDSDGTTSGSRVPDDYVKDCIGTFAGCDTLTSESCDEARQKCDWNGSSCTPIFADSPDYTACLEFEPSVCGDMPGCHLQ